MIEGLNPSLLVATATTALAQDLAGQGAAAADVARFRAAMNNTDQADSPATGAQPAALSRDAAPDTGALQAPSAANDSLSPRTLGDAILAGLKSSSNDVSRAWQAAGEILTKPDPSVADMLRLQVMLVQSTVQYELLGKTISKTTQNLDHILRTQ